MGVYRKLCYAVEDIFIKVLSKNKNPEEVGEKVRSYREQKEQYKNRKKQEHRERVQERQRVTDERKEQENQRVLEILKQVVDVDHINYTQYEFNEVKRNRAFFEMLHSRFFDKGEKGLAFLQCEFDKSSKKEIKGYLIATNKRVLFLDMKQQFSQKFTYKTINDVTWFRDGMLEKGIHIHYGTRRLEFDEIFDKDQMQRVASLIKRMASQRTA